MDILIYVVGVIVLVITGWLVLRTMQKRGAHKAVTRRIDAIQGFIATIRADPETREKLMEVGTRQERVHLLTPIFKRYLTKYPKDEPRFIDDFERRFILQVMRDIYGARNYSWGDLGKLDVNQSKSLNEIVKNAQYLYEAHKAAK
jgi:hypothetical protein